MTNAGVAIHLSETDLIDEQIASVLDDDLCQADNAVFQPSTIPIAVIGPAVKNTSPQVSVLGVSINNFTESQAVEHMEKLINETDRSRAIYFVNAHTLNTATADRAYRALLNRAALVFGDGTGVRWAARCHGIRMQANLNGTDLVPRFFRDTAGRGYRYFLLGSTPETIDRAADNARRRFRGWELVGVHHGFVFGDEAKSLAAIESINRARPRLLLVGMGNPRQEQWIDRFLPKLSVPLTMGTGGLFDHWAGNLTRAPSWVRRMGCEWVQLMLQQPHKCRRYLLGNPLFLSRIATHWLSDRRATRAARSALAERAFAR